MNNNTLRQIFESTIKSVFSNQTTFIKFLEFVSRLYQFKTTNLLLIYAQRPEAQMVKSIEKWNESKRTVNKNSKGIAIYKKKAVSFVFELNDTEGEAVVVEKERIRKSPLEEIIAKEYDARAKDFEDLIVKKVEGTLLDEMDVHSLKVAFRETVMSSTLYILEKYYDDSELIVDHRDFKWVSQFNSTESAYLILSASIILAKEIMLAPVIEYPKEIVEPSKNELEENNLLMAAKDKLFSGDLAKAELRIVEHLVSALDDNFAKRILIEEKSFENCMKFIMSSVEKIAKNNAAIVADEDVYKMAFEYFSKADLEVDRVKKKADTSSRQVKMMHSSTLKKVDNAQVSLFDGAAL